MPEHVHQALAHLQGDVAYEPVTYYDVRVPRIDIPTLDISNEINREGFQKRRYRAGQLVALVFLLADGEEADTRFGFAENDPRIDLAHDGELREHLGAAIDIGAYIHDDDGRAFEGRESGGQRGTVDTPDHALHHLGGRHDGAGVSGRHHALGDTLANKPGGDANGTVAFGADGAGSAIVHGDGFARMMDRDREVAHTLVLVEFLL